MHGSWLQTDCRHCHQPSPYRLNARLLVRKELDDIVALWVDTALGITVRDLRLMGLLVSRQDRLN